MQVVLIGLQLGELQHPGIDLLTIPTIEQAETALRLLRPDLIIIPEEHAFKLFELMDVLEMRLSIAVIAKEDSPNEIRRWTALGAQWVWERSTWERKLKELQQPQESIMAAPALSPDLDQKSSHSWQNSGPIIIAVASAFPGAGATHQALLLARYLAQSRLPVAIWEAGSRPCFDYLEYVQSGLISHKHRFEADGITFIKRTAELTYLDTVAEQYRYIILDLGDIQQLDVQPLFFRSHIPVLVGSGAEWRQRDLVQLCRSYPQQQAKWRIVLPHATLAMRKELAEVLLGRSVFAIPTVADALHEALPEETRLALSEILGMGEIKRPGLFTRRR
ncbi:hypothetical protein PghCCS26_46440 [Paenibacillus glycanilyticus]|uniref:Uncharacterized protein n=1 Tax=Paenibacillus glycanilyticus TaxID=126569 RepID=A0ABQ6NRW0_9BACL|nr:hypothetical protein [Paenibacillus glycanilyticus]GMK47514.1 hypothetical protein PghCCS26_46440 [Paenibacillus glycanilyticus]